MSGLDGALDVLAGLVLEDGQRWGEVAEPFQWEDAREILDPLDDALLVSDAVAWRLENKRIWLGLRWRWR